jgi:hypothetical protein
MVQPEHIQKHAILARSIERVAWDPLRNLNGLRARCRWSVGNTVCHWDIYRTYLEIRIIPHIPQFAAGSVWNERGQCAKIQGWPGVTPSSPWEPHAPLY